MVLHADIEEMIFMLTDSPVSRFCRQIIVINFGTEQLVFLIVAFIVEKFRLCVTLSMTVTDQVPC